MALGVYCFNWTQSSRSLSGSYNEGAVVLPLECLIPTPITLSVSEAVLPMPRSLLHSNSSSNTDLQIMADDLLGSFLAKAVYDEVVMTYSNFTSE